MFGFEMMVNYDLRKIARFEGDGFFISTVMVTDDSEYPYETGISHTDYDDGDIIVVEQYRTKEEAEENHTKWVKVFTNENLPEYLIECHAGDIGKLVEAIGVFNEDTRVYRKGSK